MSLVSRVRVSVVTASAVRWGTGRSTLALQAHCDAVATYSSGFKARGLSMGPDFMAASSEHGCNVWEVVDAAWQHGEKLLAVRLLVGFELAPE